MEDDRRAILARRARFIAAALAGAGLGAGAGSCAAEQRPASQAPATRRRHRAELEGREAAERLEARQELAERGHRPGSSDLCAPAVKPVSRNQPVSAARSAGSGTLGEA